MSISKKRRLEVIKKVNAMSPEEQQKQFFHLQMLINSKCPKGCEFIYKELPEIRDIMAGIVMITQTDMTTKALQDAECVRRS